MAIVEHSLACSFTKAGLLCRVIFDKVLLTCRRLILLWLHLVNLDLIRLECRVLHNRLNLSRRWVEKGICSVVEGSSCRIFIETIWNRWLHCVWDRCSNSWTRFGGICATSGVEDIGNRPRILMFCRRILPQCIRIISFLNFLISWITHRAW